MDHEEGFHGKVTLLAVQMLLSVLKAIQQLAEAFSVSRI